MSMYKSSDLMHRDPSSKDAALFFGWEWKQTFDLISIIDLPGIQLLRAGNLLNHLHE